MKTYRVVNDEGDEVFTSTKPIHLIAATRTPRRPLATRLAEAEARGRQAVVTACRAWYRDPDDTRSPEAFFDALASFDPALSEGTPLDAEAIRRDERVAIGEYLTPVYDSTSTRLRHAIDTLLRGELP